MTDLVGWRDFVLANLERAQHEALNAHEALADSNLIAARYHLQRMAAHTRAACGTFKDMVR